MISADKWIQRKDALFRILPGRGGTVKSNLMTHEEVFLCPLTLVVVDLCPLSRAVEFSNDAIFIATMLTMYLASFHQDITLMR